MIYTKMPEDVSPDRYVMLGLGVSRATTSEGMRTAIGHNPGLVKQYVPWSLLTDGERRSAQIILRTRFSEI